MTPLTIGIISPEFRSAFGGVEVLVEGLANSLAKTENVVVYSRNNQESVVAAPFKHCPLLTESFSRIAEALKTESVDAWLTSHAGLAPLAWKLTEPLFAYGHGNDLLQPYLSCGPRWIEAFQRPYVKRVREALRKSAIRKASSRVARFFACSHNTAHLMATAVGIPKDKISVIPPGVDDSFFQEKTPAETPLRMLTVSRLTAFNRRKNIHGVLRAVADLRPELGILYTIVGDGDDRQNLERLAADLRLTDVVHFAGNVTHEELLASYRNADLFILAAKATEIDVEGFGIVYIEASASGVPVIVSRAGGGVDAVQDGVNGILINESTPKAIADGIRRFIQERDRFPADRVSDFAERFRWTACSSRVREEIAAFITP